LCWHFFFFLLRRSNLIVSMIFSCHFASIVFSSLSLVSSVQMDS
jgi:hypothetical protein